MSTSNSPEPGEIRDARPGDHAAVLALNRAATPAVSDLTSAALAALAAEAAYFRVIVEDGVVRGFLLGLDPAAHYASENFGWFRSRYAAFVYIDRVVVDVRARGKGLGTRLYADVEAYASARAPLLACEVNTRPRNEGSLRFHERQGFVPVGAQETEQGRKEVVMLAKRLSAT